MHFAKKSRVPSNTAIKQINASGQLPNLYPVFWIQVKFVARFYIKRCIPRVEIADRIGPKLFRRMSVSSNYQPQKRWPGNTAPTLSEGHKEPLVARQTLGGWSFFTAVMCTVSVIGSGEPRDVRDIFAECLFTVQMQARQSFIGIVLRDELRRGRMEMLEVCGCPPVLQLAAKRQIGCPYRQSCG